MLACVALLAWETLAQTSRRRRYLSLMTGLAVVVMLSAVLPVVALLGVWLVWVVLLLRRSWGMPGVAVVLALLVGALSSLALLLMAPSVAGRSFLIFYALMLVPVLHALHAVSHAWRWRWAGIFVVMLILPFAGTDTLRVYEGYAQNAPVHRLNQARLRVLAHEIQAGQEAPGSVTLSRLPNDRYAETMPYQRPLIENWMKKYYGLPSSLELQWE
ncbi:DUF6056 family protein [Chromohalobacter canadensis]|uniref:DUF6056 family protein n=1 Tax=Chromohalobacter canadensis TaxID=141389 RepID=UPI00240F5D3A|nr:DUF6056 family protein [Chromohalobacter canadensis]